MDLSEIKRCKHLEKHPEEIDALIELTSGEAMRTLLWRFAEISQRGDGPIIMYVIASIVLRSSWLPPQATFECTRRREQEADITAKLRSQTAKVPLWLPLMCAFPPEECLFAARAITRIFPSFFETRVKTVGGVLYVASFFRRAGSDQPDPKRAKIIQRQMLDEVRRLGEELRLCPVRSGAQLDDLTLGPQESGIPGRQDLDLAANGGGSRER